MIKLIVWHTEGLISAARLVDALFVVDTHVLVGVDEERSLQIRESMGGQSIPHANYMSQVGIYEQGTQITRSDGALLELSDRDTLVLDPPLHTADIIANVPFGKYRVEKGELVQNDEWTEPTIYIYPPSPSLDSVVGIGPKTLELLTAAGIDSIELFVQLSALEIVGILGQSEKSATTLLENARSLLAEKE